jgi:hypothetical protein
LKRVVIETDRWVLAYFLIAIALTGLAYVLWIGRH